MKKAQKKIQKDLEIVKEAMKIFKDSTRIGAVQKLIINGDVTINIYGGKK